MALFSKKGKLQKKEAIPTNVHHNGPVQPSSPAPCLNPCPPQPVQYLALDPPPRTDRQHRQYPQWQANPEWGRSQPSFHFKSGPMLATRSYFPLKHNQSEYPSRRNNAKWNSTSNIPSMMVSQPQSMNDIADEWQQQRTEYFSQEAALTDLISNKFNSVITLIDGENFSGDEEDLGVYTTRSILANIFRQVNAHVSQWSMETPTLGLEVEEPQEQGQHRGVQTSPRLSRAQITLQRQTSTRIQGSRHTYLG
ncbi:hypothetical protein GP486_005946 [Trichoglossum hirsutum]|uniref:Uncharacterized protein n=1 Tax=Trichoglossum hirsutum TaxID=265104 RepID=A0A9P8RLB6_9PEZI|nr:hypothetical protein GP486_005946 [Trichoglossum hirsutum]